MPTSSFPLVRTTSSFKLSELGSGFFQKKGSGGLYKSHRGSELNLGQVNEYRYEWARGYDVVAVLPLKSSRTDLVIDGPVNATVTMGRATYSVSLKFCDHRIISIKSSDSWFNHQIQKAELNGKTAAYAVHRFLVRHFWWHYTKNLMKTVSVNLLYYGAGMVFLAILMREKNRL